MKESFLKFNDELKIELRKFINSKVCHPSVKQHLRDGVQHIHELDDLIELDYVPGILNYQAKMSNWFESIPDAAGAAWRYCEEIALLRCFDENRE